MPACLLLLALVLLVDGSAVPGALLLTLSIVTKPTALVVVPLVAIVLGSPRRITDLWQAAAVRANVKSGRASAGSRRIWRKTSLARAGPHATIRCAPG